jgi:putative Mg2+ transporter-C (MgtC) family protein
LHLLPGLVRLFRWHFRLKVCELLMATLNVASSNAHAICEPPENLWNGRPNHQSQPAAINVASYGKIPRITRTLAPANREENMPVILNWQQVAIRLALTVVAGALIGLNRGERGRAAGLRTTVLVCLAASVAMLLANLLMNTTGKASNSFITLDLMRLPLGILDGMGFIGAGAILRRGDRVLGVTTAATLWFVTVIGLCFGAGQLALGAAAFGLAMLVLWVFKWFEARMSEAHYATFVMAVSPDGPTEESTRGRLHAAGYDTENWAVSYAQGARRRELRFEVRWQGARDSGRPPQFIDQLAAEPGVLSLQWQPHGRA